MPTNALGLPKREPAAVNQNYPCITLWGHIVNWCGVCNINQGGFLHTCKLEVKIMLTGGRDRVGTGTCC